MNTDWEIKEHQGYIGAFTKAQAEGAIPNGTTIVKVWDEVEDSHKVGDTGTVLGSVYHPIGNIEFFYFVEWANSPKLAVGVIDKKIGIKPEDEAPDPDWEMRKMRRERRGLDRAVRLKLN